MSIGRRIATLFRVKANKALDRAEDPRETLDYSYEQQLEMVQKVRRGLADVATSRKRVELQVTQLQLAAGKLQDQAQQALAAGHEDLAREALIRRAAVTSQISDLQGQQASLQAEEEKLTLASQRLAAKEPVEAAVEVAAAGVVVAEEAAVELFRRRGSVQPARPELRRPLRRHRQPQLARHCCCCHATIGCCRQ